MIFFHKMMPGVTFFYNFAKHKPKKMNSNTLIKGSLSALTLLSALPCSSATKTSDRPNILLIMADDMGYSDIGCYGGEIPTPNIDALAARGLRFTQFYNCGRSCPTRASLLTGLYPHEAGIGAMSEDPELRDGNDPEHQGEHGYMGFLNRNCVTMAEVLRDAGYHTYMTGKWHVGMHGKEKWPLQRGFERFYGILAGATSYLQPRGGRGLTLDNTHLPAPRPPFYTTDAFTDHAITFLQEQQDDKPFFLYLAYNAPHWPLQAKDADIEKMAGRYAQGWQQTRQQRRQRMLEQGLIRSEWGLAEWDARTWDQLTEEEKDNSALRMSIYAAQVYSMDQGIGKVIDYLDRKGQLDNTLIIFLSDNGACAEPYSETGFGTIADINNQQHWVQPSYGKPWAMVSNTPFRKYKRRAYEGGIAAPLIISWPRQTRKYASQLRDNICHVTDLMVTCIDVGQASYPKTYHNGNTILPIEGKSLMPAVSHPHHKLHEYIFGEHACNCYVRWNDWKAVRDEVTDRWELYFIPDDRTERHDLAASKPQLLGQLVRKWEEWARSHHVFPKGKGGRDSRLESPLS